MGYSDEPDFPILAAIEKALSFIVYMAENIAENEKDPGFAMFLQILFYLLVLPVYLFSKLILFLIKEFIKSRR